MLTSHRVAMLKWFQSRTLHSVVTRRQPPLAAWRGFAVYRQQLLDGTEEVLTQAGKTSTLWMKDETRT